MKRIPFANTRLIRTDSLAAKINSFRARFIFSPTTLTAQPLVLAMVSAKNAHKFVTKITESSNPLLSRALARTRAFRKFLRISSGVFCKKYTLNFLNLLSSNLINSCAFFSDKLRKTQFSVFEKIRSIRPLLLETTARRRGLLPKYRPGRRYKYMKFQRIPF